MEDRLLYCQSLRAGFKLTMRVCLLYPPRPGGRGTNLVPPVGLLYLGGILEREGHSVSLVDAALSGHTGSNLLRDVLNTEPDLIMVSAFTSDVYMLSSQLPRIREALPSVPIWLGGPHASCVGKAAFDDLPQVDAVFIGEAEESIVEALNFPECPPAGVLYREDRSSTEAGEVKDLSTLPLPAWHLAPPERYRGLPNGVVLKKMPYAPIITTRGCPYKCTFCAGFRITGRKIRHRPLDQVWREIEMLVCDYGVKEIHIEDDNFTFDADYAREFCREAIRRKLPVLFSTPNGIRLDTLDHQLLDLMHQAGWYIVHCGIESGSDRVLKRVKKATTTDQIRKSIQLIHQHGLPVAGYFILGLPGETVEDMQMTIDFAISSGIEWAHFASFLPIPGSEDGDEYLSKHDLSSKGWSFFHNTACPAPPDSVTRRELKKLQRKAFTRFYFRPAQLARLTGLLFKPGVTLRVLRRAMAYLTGSSS